jgi:hypothetical protein
MAELQSWSTFASKLTARVFWLTVRTPSENHFKLVNSSELTPCWHHSKIGGEQKPIKWP